MDQKRIRELEQKISTDYGNTTGVAVLKEGKLVYEKYFKGCTRESQVHVYSVTKSIISILIGIAVDRGYIQSVDQKVLDFFPGYIVRKRENTIQNITVKDMLTMTAPYKYRFFAPYVKYFQVIAKLAKLVRNLELKQERLRAGFKERHKKEDNYQF